MADLKDYRWSMSGMQQVYFDLTLNDPNFLCQSVYYKAQEKEADIELMFWEGSGVYQHSRTYSINVTGATEGLDRTSVAGAISQIFTGATLTIPE